MQYDDFLAYLGIFVCLVLGVIGGIYLTVTALIILTAILVLIAGVSWDRCSAGSDFTAALLLASVVALVFMWVSYGVSVNWDTLSPYILR
ncbi:MAG: hypothetical protein HY455_02265 [Parcubacteria group bacterium]|nr:hypothetical protein [Parcubacteria group bacterium]